MHKRDYTLDDYVQAFNDLYITERKKHIKQRQKDTIVKGELKKKGSYIHISRYKLHDGIIKQHLQQKETIGIFAGSDITKFITFDVDFDNLDKAKQVARELVFALENEFHIQHEQILVSFSGSKGYHVTLFFDKVIKLTDVETFYNAVRKELGCTIHEIELRPTTGNGVKLPLSINWKSGRRQYFVNPYTMNRIADTAIFQVKKVNRDIFLDYLSEFKEDNNNVIQFPKHHVKDSTNLSKKEKAEFNRVMDRTNLDIPVNYDGYVMQMLEENKLIYEDSRHKATLFMLTFLAQQGYTEEQATNIVKSVITNTYENHRELIDAKKTLKHCLSEVDRLWKYACTYNLGHEAKKSIRVYEEEIKKVLIPKRIHLKQLLFILLVHSKRHARKDGTFFMTYKQMSEYGSTDNLGRLVKYVNELEKLGLIEIVARKRKKKDSTELLPNVYRVNICCQSENFLDLELQNDSKLEFESVVTQLIPENELKSVVTQKQFYSHFKEHYKVS